MILYCVNPLTLEVHESDSKWPDLIKGGQDVVPLFILINGYKFSFNSGKDLNVSYAPELKYLTSVEVGDCTNPFNQNKYSLSLSICSTKSGTLRAELHHSTNYDDGYSCWVRPQE